MSCVWQQTGTNVSSSSNWSGIDAKRPNTSVHRSLSKANKIVVASETDASDCGPVFHCQAARPTRAASMAAPTRGSARMMQVVKKDLMSMNRACKVTELKVSRSWRRAARDRDGQQGVASAPAARCNCARCTLAGDCRGGGRPRVDQPLL